MVGICLGPCPSRQDVLSARHAENEHPSLHPHRPALQFGWYRPVYWLRFGNSSRSIHRMSIRHRIVCIPSFSPRSWFWPVHDYSRTWRLPMYTLTHYRDRGICPLTALFILPIPSTTVFHGWLLPEHEPVHDLSLESIPLLGTLGVCFRFVHETVNTVVDIRAIPPEPFSPGRGLYPCMTCRWFPLSVFPYVVSARARPPCSRPPSPHRWAKHNCIGIRADLNSWNHEIGG